MAIFFFFPWNSLILILVCRFAKIKQLLQWLLPSVSWKWIWQPLLFLNTFSKYLYNLTQQFFSLGDLISSRTKLRRILKYLFQKCSRALTSSTVISFCKGSEFRGKERTPYSWVPFLSASWNNAKSSRDAHEKFVISSTSAFKKTGWLHFFFLLMSRWLILTYRRGMYLFW